MPCEVDVDLRDLISDDIGDPRRVGSRPFWCCPLHDDRNPSLTLTPDGLHWKCFGCGKYGDAIDWVRELRGLSFKEATSLLNTRVPIPSQRERQRQSRSFPRQAMSVNPQWSTWAERVVEGCEHILNQTAAQAARRWLHGRGLTSSTLSRWQIGFNPKDQELNGMWVPRGITIPWSHSGQVEAINVRRLNGDPKYRMVTGSHRQGLYLGEAIEPGRPTLLVEGEFDALLGWQEAGTIANVATVGSASMRPDSRAITQILGSPLILLAYDRDEAGTKGARFWNTISARAHSVCLPHGNDLTEFVQSGGNLGKWIAALLISFDGLANNPTPDTCLQNGVNLK